MKAIRTTVINLMLSALLFGVAGGAQAGGQGGPFNSPRGGQASVHRNNIGSANSNAQWSADPTRGWVRAGERQELGKHRAAAKENSDKGKKKSDATTKGY